MLVVEIKVYHKQIKLTKAGLLQVILRTRTCMFIYYIDIHLLYLYFNGGPEGD